MARPAPTALKAQAGTDARRDVVLTAAATLFRRRGFNGVGIDDIGVAIGLTGPAVYHYFPGKNGLLAAIIDRLLTNLETAAEIALPTSGGGGPVDNMIAAALAAPDSLAVCLRQLGYLDRDARAPLEARCRAMVTAVNSYGAQSHRPHLRARAIAGAIVSLSLAKSPATVNVPALGAECFRRILAVPLPPRSAIEPHAARMDLRRRAARAFRPEAILAEAARLFHQRGFNGVSLADIGAECGITGSAVNRRFGSKEKLLAAAFTRFGDQIGAAIYHALATANQPATAVTHMVSSYATAAVNTRDLVCLNMFETHHLPREDRQERRKRQRAYADELAFVLAEADPSISSVEAKARARAAYSVISEVIHNDELAAREGLTEDLTALALAVLGQSP
ncbi:TetR/AcrR family transcriptional regulator [Mycobacterium sp.]|uniref:TetR/AcrR family transcriptional regulator n=1 Tax=Mycobacterium sp. TaxID=1785 RepID=UPI003BA9F5A1